ncbi:hypothetical protein M3Y99_00924700 [Aphelenchoides fujianensis]|nr:hypothetical protein M3Y99_00924700 [Aphelenchoides fujianensis]
MASDRSRWLLLTLLLASACRVEGTIDWKFSTFFDGPFTFDIQLGTPPVSTQVLGLVDSWDAISEDLSVSDSTVGGAYDYTQSSSWVQTGVHHDVNKNPDGLIGTETFIIG